MIPKIIHQIWLGPHSPPIDWLNTWKNGFCAKYNWVYKLWRESDVEELNIVNHTEYKYADNYQQKSDIVRYEVLYRFGGIYLDCDMIWLNSNLEDYLPINTSNFIGVLEFPSRSTTTIGPPYISNGFICCSKGNVAMKRCIEDIPERVKLGTRHAFIRTGPVLLNKSIKEPIVVLPYIYVFPKDFHKKTDVVDPMEFKDTSIIFTYNGTEYPHIKK